MCPESASLSTWRGLATSGLAWQALQHGLVRLGSVFGVLSKTHLPPGMGGELVPTPDPRSWKRSGFLVSQLSPLEILGSPGASVQGGGRAVSVAGV